MGAEPGVNARHARVQEPQPALIPAERCYFYPFADAIPGFLKLSSNAASRMRDYKDPDVSALISFRSLLG